MPSHTTCPNCSFVLRQGARFCPRCGQMLSSGSGVGPSQPKHGGTQLVSSGPRLLVRMNGQLIQEIHLSGQPITIGRLPSNTVVVNWSNVSRQHAEIRSYIGGYAVIDLASSNGTYLRGQKIRPQTSVKLEHGDVIRVGDQSGNSIVLTYQEKESPVSVQGKIDLGQTQLGNMACFTIGRDPASNLSIDSPVVSWHHAEVVRTVTGHQLNDLGSTNGTYVNGTKIRSMALNLGDRVQIGPYLLVYSPAGFQKASSIGSVRLDGIHLTKEVPARNSTKVILNDVSLTVLPREFVALIGGSGAGKSTLMDALNGFRRPQKGQVLINGDDLYQNYGAYSSNMGYVPQSDILHTGLPVRRALRYTAQLRLPPDTLPDVIDKHIEEALCQVDMLPQIDQQITSLSGGQRKRVSIASELLSDPSLFFLDEPTSGLDPGLDKKMMFTLNTLADNGRTVVLTTHATSNIIGQCDQVAFLAHGRMVYFGPPDRAIQFFQVTDFADIYSRLDTPKGAEDWEQRYRASQDYQQYLLSRQRSIQRKAGMAAGRGQASAVALEIWPALRQFAILATRYVDLIINDKLSIFILLAVMPIIGFLLLLIANAKSLGADSAKEIERVLEEDYFYQVVTDAQKLLLMISLSVILLGVFAAGYEIVKEKPIYRRERMVNLGIGPYLASKIAVLMGFGLLQCFFLLVVVSFKVDFPRDGVILPAPIEMYFTLALAMLVGITIGLFISAIVKSSNIVIYLFLVVLFVQIIFSGVLFVLPGFAKPISLLTPTRWAMEGLGASVDMDSLNDLSQQYIEEIDGMEVNRTIQAPIDFNIDYRRSVGHLSGTWFLQLFYAAVFVGLTAWILQRQDIQI